MFLDIMVSLFVAAVVLAAVIGFVVVCCKKPEVLVMVAFVAIMIVGMIFLPGALAEDEIRCVTVVEFNLEHGLVVLEDEDGYLWLWGLGDHSWFVGQEFEMVLADEPYLIWEQ